MGKKALQKETTHVRMELEYTVDKTGVLCVANEKKSESKTLASPINTKTAFELGSSNANENEYDDDNNDNTYTHIHAYNTHRPEKKYQTKHEINKIISTDGK